MLTQAELHQLLRELSDASVLSVYVDLRAEDPAMRHAWRPTLLAAVRQTRGAIADEADRAAVDRAAALVDEMLSGSDDLHRSPGWVAFVTADGVHHQSGLPVHPGTSAVWRRGPHVGPYLRALKQHRPVIVAMVESRSARLYRYAQRQLELLEEHSTSLDEAGGAERITGPATRAGAAPVARGAVGTDAAQRRRTAAFQRMIVTVADRIVHLASDDAWVLVGGTPSWAPQAAAALPPAFTNRTLVSATLDHDATDADIALEAKRAASQLRATWGTATVEQLVEQANGQARAAVGTDAVRRSLEAHAVDLLVLSPGFTREGGAESEDLLRLALAQGADVEVLSEPAGSHLDRAAGGIAARLRFRVPELGREAEESGAEAG